MIVTLLRHRRRRRPGDAGHTPAPEALPPAVREAAGRGDEGVPEAGRRPELITLDEAQTARVTDLLAEQGWCCASCGGRGATVGSALYLGFLFLSEDLDAYMVALTCRNPVCRRPRDGIRLREADFAPDGIQGNDEARR